ncbi:MAG TPA: hypothetical protein VFP68_17810 [Burkholderiaceae bacterium]|nr:hypothetical protein [Burkholderiaceae bacterium]
MTGTQLLASYFLGTGFYVGHGWYRKHLDLPQSSRGKRITVEFDGVFQDAVVWVNGHEAGRHVGGYTGFSIDITPYAKPGRNLLAVHVNNEWSARVAPRSGEHVFSGGIYRSVRLVTTDPVHVDWYGTFVTTPQVSEDKATVQVQTEVRNDHAGVPKTVVLGLGERVRQVGMPPAARVVARLLRASRVAEREGPAAVDELARARGRAGHGGQKADAQRSGQAEKLLHGCSA